MDLEHDNVFFICDNLSFFTTRETEFAMPYPTGETQQEGPNSAGDLCDALYSNADG